MNKALRNEILTVCGLGALGSLLLGRPRVAAGFGLAAASAALLTDIPISFRGQSVVITGGSRGLGLALAKELVREEAYVTLLARDAQELDRARQLLLFEWPQARVQTLVCDVTQQDQLSIALEETVKAFGAIDVLINNAGAILVAPFESLSREDFEAQMNLHFYAILQATQWVLPHFLRRGKGRIVNICSVGGRVAVPHMIPYDASKFALAGFSQGLAAELERHRIPVTTIYPTLMRTGSPIQAVFKGDYEKEYAWFATGDNLPGFSMSASLAARKILFAARHGQRELILGIWGKARVGFSAVFPEVSIAMMSLMNRLMPRGKERSYHTGAESRHYLDKKLAGSLLRKGTEKVERQLNQEPKEDAKFNLGLLH
jgi:short-subunit dehydrogenase